jgi:hypothetical protein
MHEEPARFTGERCARCEEAAELAKRWGWPFEGNPQITPAAWLHRRLEIAEANYAKVCGDREELRRELRGDASKTCPPHSSEKWHSRFRGSLLAYGRPLEVVADRRAPGHIKVVWRGSRADPTLQAGEVPLVSESFHAGTPTDTARERVEQFIEDYFRKADGG